MKREISVEELENMLDGSKYILKKSKLFENVFYIYSKTELVIELDSNPETNLIRLFENFFMWKVVYEIVGSLEQEKEKEGFYELYNFLKIKIRKNKIKNILY